MSAKKDNAYRITPTFSDYESGKGMKRGEVTYAFAQSSEAEANDNAVIYTFTVNVPNEKGTYSVGLDTGSKLVNKVVPEEHYVAGNKSYKLNDDPSLDGEDGLIFYLVNVRFRVDDADSEMENPQTVSADDAQCRAGLGGAHYKSIGDTNFRQAERFRCERKRSLKECV